MSSPDPVAEGARLLTICNACRYCEGHCAVFPAMELRRDFPAPDLAYLANLCHDCGACYHHCQYAPPHEFAVNLPRALSELRSDTYAQCAWPRLAGAAFARAGAVTAMATAAALALALVLAFALIEPAALFGRHVGEGAFYRVIPHDVMIWTFGLAFAYAVLALAVGYLRFRRLTGDAAPAAGGLGGAASDAASLRYLGGGGPGCTYPEEAPSAARRWFHHLTLYGFLLCFAATSVATVYHYGFGWQAPYGWTSLPVVLGTLGGIGLIIGPAGLLWLAARARRAAAAEGEGPVDPAREGLDSGFAVLLILVSATGLALLALRESAAMGLLLAVHLGTVAALFVTIPYGKFVHGIYRFAALQRYARERARGAPAGAPRDGE